jgi:myosin tail region-interacting protein MTI1
VPAAVQPPSPGSESDEEMPGNAHDQDPGSPPPPPRAPTIPAVPSRRSTHEVESPVADRQHGRGPPPPVPAAAPPVPSRKATDFESEYEGDYDTDIASGAKHKDALKAHARESSLDDSTFAEDTPSRPVPPPPAPSHARAPPPPPPKVPPRSSIDSPRGPPPLPPSAPLPPPVPPRSPTEDEDYDPFRYGGLPVIPRSPPAVPNAPPAFAPPIPPPVPPRNEESSEEDDDDLYSRPSDRPPPPPPHAPAPTSPVTSPRVGASEFSPPRRARQSTDSGRRSLDQPGRPSLDRLGFIASETDLGKSTQWWAQPGQLPPVFQGRTDILFEIEENATTKRGGKTTIAKDVYVLFNDYSQIVISVRYDAKNPADAQLDQRHQAPPPQMRQDQLEAAYAKYGAKLAQTAHTKQNTVVGDGSPDALVLDLLKTLQEPLLPVGTRAYGAAVYSNLANATVQQYDEIRPGDIVSFRNAKFQGKHGGVMHQKYAMDVGKPDHVGVVVEWDGTKKKVRAIEQGRDGKKAKVESFRLGDLRSGEVRVWRVMGRDWVGWSGDE